MDERQRGLLNSWRLGELPSSKLLEMFPADQALDSSFVAAEVASALGDEDMTALDDAVQLVLIIDAEANLDLLNRLLVTPGHHHHQAVAKALQGLAEPSTVPFARKALEMGFEHLEYTASENGVVAKWYSWLLAAIGTPDAIRALQEFAGSDDEEVACEMKKRLSKVQRSASSS